MLVNSFTQVLTLNLGNFEYSENLKESVNGKSTTRKNTVKLRYTGIFVKSSVDKMFILKSQTNEDVLLPTIEKIKELPYYGILKGEYTEEIPSSVNTKINELFSTVSEEIDGISVIGLYLSNFISIDSLHKCVENYLTAFNAGLGVNLTISKNDCVKYASLALAVKQGLVNRDNDSSVLSLKDRIKMLQTANDKQKALENESKLQTNDATNEALKSKITDIEETSIKLESVESVKKAFSDKFKIDANKANIIKKYPEMATFKFNDPKTYDHLNKLLTLGVTIDVDTVDTVENVELVTA